jgi:hypothetical protein
MNLAVARMWAAVTSSVCTPAQDKRPLGDAHPKKYARNGAGVYGSASEWAMATGFCAMPTPPYAVIDVDDADAQSALVRYAPQLAYTLVVPTSKGAHYYVRLDEPARAPQRIMVDGKELLSVRGGQWNTYAVGPGSARADGFVYPLPDGIMMVQPLAVAVLEQMSKELGDAPKAMPEPRLSVSRSQALGRTAVERYVAAAIAGEVQRVRLALEGSRNLTLFQSALRLLAFVKAGFADRYVVLDRLAEAAQAAGLPAVEVWRTLKSAERYAMPIFAERKIARLERKVYGK